MPTKALCVLDGGQISTTCAALACQQFDEVHGITCSYGHHGQIEIESAIAVAEMLSLASHDIVDINLTPTLSSPYFQSSLHEQPASTPQHPKEGESDFPSAQNILILTLAANQAAARGIKDLVMGVCREDFAKDFNPRQDFIDLMARVLGEGLWRDPAAFKIHTPLMHLTRVESANLAMNVMGDQFQAIFELTHDCSLGIEGGCGECPSCFSRDRTFEEIGIEDPIWKFRHPEFSSPVPQLYKLFSSK
ncbi:7-cyano-7-deazaguanine synthase (plasmid) [Kovacikia minuta CCNUW1]|uniref:7-cyano-7-deazaguanine synthase n=1 Tax=Kovacikia minuta TaxID=2931930 RepID=UPI001CCB8A40|nr:7-cyano-7-deazaguanine synthase [Kovacikia minuta]UBF29998.1 7-cyano-7-deazaguanine synthase [Kovacikia minuta CCNUW1]